MFRKHLSYANVVATMALVFAMSGGALAASHYLLNSTKQINPKLLKKLTGKTGATGRAGVTGKEGAAGKEGTAGKNGANLTAETTLPSGQSESGTFAAGSGYVDSGEELFGKKYYGFVGTGITYVQPLAKAVPDGNVIDVTTGSATHCPGVGSAAPGYLCLYDWDRDDVSTEYFYSESKSETETTTAEFSKPSPGAVVYWAVEEPGIPYVGGEYTVTAP